MPKVALCSQNCTVYVKTFFSDKLKGYLLSISDCGDLCFYFFGLGPSDWSFGFLGVIFLDYSSRFLMCF